MKLSPNFTLEEMTRSATAEKKHIDNTPSNAIVNNLAFLCINILQPLRDIVGPVTVTSGYRCPALNKAVGGVANSYHLTGRAADLHVDGDVMMRYWAYLLMKMPYLDKVIYEGTRKRPWLHVQWSINPRHQLIDLRKNP